MRICRARKGSSEKHLPRNRVVISTGAQLSGEICGFSFPLLTVPPEAGNNVLAHPISLSAQTLPVLQPLNSRFNPS
jgi:hypothetical protein